MFENTEALLIDFEAKKRPINVDLIREALNRDREAVMRNGDEDIAERFDSLAKCVEIQCSEGHWNHNEYMYGMANGLILALHIMTGSVNVEPPYLDRPEKWHSESGAEEPTPPNPKRRLGDGTAPHVK
jgi:hypothetical protein